MRRNVWTWIKVLLPVTMLMVALCLPAAAHACGGYHIVQRGDTLYSIAWRNGTTVWAIAQANGIRNPNYIWTGQRLYIPCGGGGGWYGGCGSTHIVSRGQNLSMIARWYGTTAWAIARANGLSNPSLIWAGQRLYIPCGGGGWYGGCRYTHIVSRGQNLSMIGRWYGTTAWVIARASGLSNPNLIWAGQRLCIP